MIPSLIRTATPLIVGWLAALLISLGINVSDDQRAWLVTAIGNLLALAYYAFARWAERRWPWATVLLGSSQQPVAYTSDGATPPPAVTPADPEQPAAGVPPSA